MTGASDTGEPSYSPPRALSPALQLSSNGDGSFLGRAEGLRALDLAALDPRTFASLR